MKKIYSLLGPILSPLFVPILIALVITFIEAFSPKLCDPGGIKSLGLPVLLDSAGNPIDINGNPLPPVTWYDKLPIYLVNIVSVLLGIIALISIVYMLKGSITYVFLSDNKGKSRGDNAKAEFRRGVIGLFLAFILYILYNIILKLCL